MYRKKEKHNFFLERLSVLEFLLLQQNNTTKSKLGRKGFMQLMFSHLCSSPKEVRPGIQPGQEPGGSS